jgi:hypothetical protein
VSNTGWITGIGLYDPDGPGGDPSYQRLFLLHVPEPSATALALLALFMPFIRRSRN